VHILLTALADFLFPASCCCCGVPLSDGERVACRPCRDAVPPLDAHHPLFLEVRGRLTAGGAVDDLVSAFVFEERGCLQTVLHRMKYGDTPSIGAMLGTLLAARLPSGIAAAERPILVPVPLHGTKLRERGYNQSAEICRGIAAAAGLDELPGALVRVRPTVSQTTLSRRERRANVAGAFAVRPGAGALLRDRSVILVDDVITTGATITECAGAVRAAGAGPVRACSVALAARIPPFS
jgi:ComF family protein